MFLHFSKIEECNSTIAGIIESGDVRGGRKERRICDR